MDQLFSMGKKMFKNKNKEESGEGASSSSGGGGGLSANPMKLLKQFDRDGDGNITENDFVLAIQQMGLGGIGEQPVRAAFKQLDKNRNGKLDMSEALGLVEFVKDMFKKKQQQEQAQ